MDKRQVVCKKSSPARKSGLLVGLTGGIACGKSLAAACLAKRGAQIISADELAAAQLRPGAAPYRAVAARYGAKTLLPDGAINRKFLAAKVFSDKSTRSWLESLIHPLVLAQIRSLAAKSRRKLVVAEIPLLFETGAQNCFDFTLCLAARKALRAKRARARGWTAAETARREAAQLPLERKCALSDIVVSNDGSKTELDRKIGALFQAFEVLAEARGKQISSRKQVRLASKNRKEQRKK